MVSLMKTQQMKLDDAFRDVSPCLLRQAAEGRLHAVLISSQKQSEYLTKAFNALGVPYESTDNMQIFNAVPGFVCLRDEASAKRLNEKMHGLDCDTTRLVLNPDAKTLQEVIRHKYVSGGRDFGSFP
jgi:hypothetical protein